MPTPRVVKQCIAGVSLPTTPRQRGSVLEELHCLTAWGQRAVQLLQYTALLPGGSGQ